MKCLIKVGFFFSSISTRKVSSKSMTPKHSRGSINRIGKILIADDISPRERDAALGELNDWRSLHLEPMNAFQATLRGYVRKIDPKHGIVVLVSVDSIKKMEKAYPNFFSNIADFNKELDRLYQEAVSAK